MTAPSEDDRARTFVHIADEMRALSNAGLRFTTDPYQIERYQRIIELAAELVGQAEARPQSEVRRHFFADMGYITPYAVVDTAVFDARGHLLLIQRADNGRWALPGGACDVGEPPATSAAREVWEETASVAEVTHFLGVFDNRLHGGRSVHHLYCLLFAGRVVEGSPAPTRESRQVAWVAPEEIPWQELAGSHAGRIRHALAWWNDPSLPPHFDRAPWQPTPTWHHDLDDG